MAKTTSTLVLTAGLPAGHRGRCGYRQLREPRGWPGRQRLRAAAYRRRPGCLGAADYARGWFLPGQRPVAVSARATDDVAAAEDGLRPRRPDGGHHSRDRWAVRLAVPVSRGAADSAPTRCCTWRAPVLSVRDAAKYGPNFYAGAGRWVRHRLLRRRERLAGPASDGRPVPHAQRAGALLIGRWHLHDLLLRWPSPLEKRRGGGRWRALFAASAATTSSTSFSFERCSGRVKPSSCL